VRLLLASPAALAAIACAPVPAASGVQTMNCDAARAQSLVGKPATAALGAEALRLGGARTLRWLRPGDIVTMEYREDRLNIELDPSSRVRAVRCG
jgi:hypothetical protein